MTQTKLVLFFLLWWKYFHGPNNLHVVHFKVFVLYRHSKLAGLYRRYCYIKGHIAFLENVFVRTWTVICIT